MMRYVQIAGLCFVAVLMPVSVQAAVLVTEIMYDLPGTDSGREWIEITNTGEGSVTATELSFFENSSNHALIPVSGGEVIVPGASAVIVSDPARFVADWPQYAGMLFDSSFSLSNDGETLEIRKGSEVLDSIVYNPAVGAGGDGNTLHRSGNVFMAASPSPGAYAVTVPVQAHIATTTTIIASQEDGRSSGGGGHASSPSAIGLDVKGSRHALRDVPLHMTARVTTKSGGLDPSASVVWSFGDGSSSLGTMVDKTYRYSGTYLVVVRAVDGGAEARQEFPIIVTAAAIRIPSVTNEGVVIANDSKERLDLSGWRLLSDGRMFRIPEGMNILPEAQVLIPWEVMNIPIAFEVQLQYPTGVVAARFSPDSSSVQIAQDLPPAPQAKEIGVQLPVQSERYSAVGTNGRSVVDEKRPSTVATTNIITSHDEGMRAPAAANELAAAGAALPDIQIEPVTQNSSFGTVLQSGWTYGLLGVLALAGSVFISF